MGDAVGRRAGDVFAFKEQRSRGRRKGSSQEVEERRLAGAVRSDDRMQRAGLDAQAHRVHRGERAEGLGQAVRCENRHMRDQASTTPPLKKSTTMMKATPSNSGQRAHTTLIDSESQMKTNEPMIGP